MENRPENRQKRSQRDQRLDDPWLRTECHWWSQRGLCSYVTYRVVGQDLPINHTWEVKKGKESKMKPELLSAAPGRMAFTGREGGWAGYT